MPSTPGRRLRPTPVSVRHQRGRLGNGGNTGGQERQGFETRKGVSGDETILGRQLGGTASTRRSEQRLLEQQQMGQETLQGRYQSFVHQ